MSDIPVGTVYEMCKIEHDAMPKAKEKDIIASLAAIKERITSSYIKIVKAAQYFMLLCNELHDYTLFNLNHTQEYDKVIADLRECLENRGEIIEITLNEDRVGEIWLRMHDTKEIHCYHFFDYDVGVLEY